MEDSYYFWYRLDDIDFNGNTTLYETYKVYREKDLILDFEFFQNYHYPFNQQTLIFYQIHAATRVDIIFYNVAGELVFRNEFAMVKE